MTKKKEENFKSILEEIGESEVIPDAAEPNESLRTIIDKLAVLEEKFDRTFNNHTVIHGRFRRGRKTINK